MSNRWIGFAGIVWSLCGCAFAQELKLGLREAARATDPAVRSAVADFVGAVVWDDGKSILGKLVGDTDPKVRCAAIRALGGMRDEAAADHLLAALSDDTPGNVRYALDYLGMGAPRRKALAQVAAFLKADKWWLRTSAAGALGRLGANQYAREVRALLLEMVDAPVWQQQGLAPAFALLRTSEDMTAVKAYRASKDPTLRAAAEEAWHMLEHRDHCGPDCATCANVRARGKYARLNRTALQRLRAGNWREVPLARLLDVTKKARLVLFGELHEKEGALRVNQVAILRAWSSASTADMRTLALGYEPSVEKAQETVIEYARRAKLTVMSMERQWRKNLEMGSLWSRDDQAAEAIKSWLSKKEHRLFVIRGQGHVLPGGYLESRLAVKPVVVLSLPTGCLPLDVLGDRPSVVGRVFEVGDENRVFMYCCRELIGEGKGQQALYRILAQH